MSRRIRGICLVVLGFLLLSGGIIIYSVYDQQDQIAGRNAEVLLAQILQGEEEIDMLPLPEEEVKLPSKTYSGYEVIGILQIPTVGIELPVLSEWNDEMLEIAPCRYSGTVINENMILMGHNYKSHFKPLHNISEGATVEFVSVEGTHYRYSVADIIRLHKSEVEKLESDYPLTLFTCTAGGQNRLIVRCEKQE